MLKSRERVSETALKNTLPIRILAAILLFALSSTANGPTLVVIVNKANPISEITKSQLKKLILGKQSKWPGGAEVSVLLGPAGEPDRKTALQRYCGMTEADFAEWFLHAIFKGESLAAPKSMPSVQSIVTVVQIVPGAIGFVDSAYVGNQVKVIGISTSAE